MNSGTVIAIHTAATARGPVESVEQVRAVPGKGLEGDRYFDRQGTFFRDKGPAPDKEVTLIEEEALDALRREYKVSLAARESRRNILTRGVALNHLVGREFAIGGATLRGIRLCEPCGHLERLTGRNLKGLAHRGGLRAQVLEAGEIHVGDAIEVRERKPEQGFSAEFLDILDCLGGDTQ